jgi:ADP-ribose pyrophosphatase YjhB (NUDIX family)
MDYIQYLRGMVGNKPAIFVAAVVLIMDASNRLLLQRRADDGTWGLVGGIMNLGETVEEAARREVLEETGLTVGEVKLFGVFSFEHTYPGGNRAQTVSVVYTSDDIQGKPEVNDAEGLELRYFALGALPGNLFPPNVLILEAIQRRFAS